MEKEANIKSTETSIEQDEANLTAFQIRERKERTIFVGNINLATTSK